MAKGLIGLSPERKIAALGGFVLLGLTPSYVDFQNATPAKRRQMIAFYVGAMGLFYYGLLS